MAQLPPARHFAPPCGAAAPTGALQPPRVRYWLTPPVDEAFDAKVRDVCTLYAQAPQLVAAGERVLSTDELTGVQALERKHPGLPPLPGQVERREFAYIRHGTRPFIINRSWLNQVEIWLSILVRKLLKRGNFTSVEDLATKVLEFIAYYNRTMAKPFAWTYQGKALGA